MLSLRFRPRYALILALGLLTSLAARSAVQNDIEYGTADGESLRLDVSTPDGVGPFPAVILVHGGGWTAGDKSGGPKKGYMAPMQDALTKAGYAYFTINYRLAPKYHHPAQLEDVQTAIRWVKAHTKEYHLDPKRIALSGESAGGQLVALAAVKADDSTRVAAVIPFYGVFDMVEHAKKEPALSNSFKALFGREQVDDETLKMLHDASPVESIKTGLPPFLLVHGTADQSVAYSQSIEFQKKLQAAGIKCDLITVPGGPHGMLYWDKFLPDYREQVVAWLNKTLKVRKSKSKPQS